jgi:hypothetical protein
VFGILPSTILAGKLSGASRRDSGGCQCTVVAAVLGGKDLGVGMRECG